MTSKVQTRVLKKTKHRQMLVEAAADIIAENGITNTSVTRIIEKAGLSRGMVHLHFDSKDALLVEVARDMSRQYYAKLDCFLAQAGPLPQQKLETIVAADLSEQILNRRWVNIWHAIRSEARSQNAFMIYSDTRDDALRDMIFEACCQLSGENKKRAVIARDAMNGTIALLEGMWTDFFLHSDAFNRKAAKRIVFRFMAALFPHAFNLNGAIVE
ncbi:MAG: TetR family transcriptional regulator [Alphaproteobacteria bacterium]|nr:TetR family transcriptional regulator [Alphaproteobacteria bacterium]